MVILTPNVYLRDFYLVLTLNGAATYDYLHYQLICQLFSRSIYSSLVKKYGKIPEKMFCYFVLFQKKKSRQS